MAATNQAVNLMALFERTRIQGLDAQRELRTALRAVYEEGQRDEAQAEKLAQQVAKEPRGITTQQLQDLLDECEKKYRTPEEIAENG